MKNWRDKKKEITAIPTTELNHIQAVAQVVNALFQRRVELGLTQAEVAERAGLKQESIARLENGNVVPRLDTVFKVAHALGMKLTAVDQHDEEATTAQQYA
jgi:transcriptional regulator with XRE-family HTH domain